ncbi:MAG: hypothetical protein IPN77_29270 [Sandaracinaceae bacterium]|nr:hypothetical protein [Sandaracinaceae bacterium]
MAEREASSTAAPAAPRASGLDCVPAKATTALSSAAPMKGSTLPLERKP